MSINQDSVNIALQQKLHGETAKIHWSELQLFFAQGSVLWVSGKCDLIEVAVHFAQDRSTELKPMLDDGRIAIPSNQQARHWYQADSELWSVVVAPFVLVQEAPETES